MYVLFAVVSEFKAMKECLQKCNDDCVKDNTDNRNLAGYCFWDQYFCVDVTIAARVFDGQLDPKDNKDIPKINITGLMLKSINEPTIQ